MAKVAFSSWGNRVVDNRDRDPGNYQDAPELRLPDIDNSGARVGGLMGWDGIIITDKRVSVVGMARAYMEAVVRMLCQRCTTCRQGTKLILAALTKIVDGNGSQEDLDTIEHLANVIRNTGMCSLGQTPVVPILDSVRYFRQEYLDLIQGKHSPVPTTYKVGLTAPCQNACPIHLDVPGYVELIKGQRYLESLALIRERAALPGTLGRVCVHFCEQECRRGALDEPICIKALKRHVADYEIALDRKPEAAKPANGKAKVAVVGAGPAGLAAGYYLGQRGYPVTIFEALPVAGGMAAVGIPAYRLPKDVLQREIDIVKSAGVEIVCGVRVGKDITLKDLREKGYKAIFVAVGCHDSSSMGVEGEDAGYEGFIPGVKFLRDLNLGHKIEVKDRVAIVGGGNVAMDCARSAIRLGFREVHLIYRRSRAEMPANEEEIEDAEKEGVIFHFLTNPTKIIARDGRVVGLELIRMELGEPDASGRRRPVPISGSEYTMDVDVVIPAIGQTTDLSVLGSSGGVKSTRRGTIEVNQATLATSEEGVFAGGDCVTGPATLVEALAAGNRAAHVIDRYLRGESLEHSDQDNIEEIFDKLGVYNRDEDVESATGRERAPLHHQPVCILDPQSDVGAIGGRRRAHQVARPVDERVRDFDEVELGFEPRTAVLEAERCIRCYRVGLIATLPEGDRLTAEGPMPAEESTI